MQQQNSFFKDLVSKSLMNDWAKNIDWLLNDNKFDKWTINDKKRFTKLIKDYFKSNNIDYKTLKIDELKDIKPKNVLYVYINSYTSESIDIIRHIRNGIAHGHCNIKKGKNKILYLILIDYNKKKEITAKLNIPIDMINNIRLLYNKTRNM